MAQEHHLHSNFEIELAIPLLVQLKVRFVGDNVNYTNRIETANRELGTKLLLSEEAYMEVRNDYPNYNLFKTNIKGKTGQYNLYEVY